MREEVAGISRWTAEWSVKWDGVEKVETANGERGVEVGMESQWSWQEPQSRNVKIEGWGGRRSD
jgi:hypothetical protein